MTLKLPDFANNLLAKIARENGFKKFSMEIKPGSKPGDGTNSDIIRVEIVKNTNKLELVCKIAPNSENRRSEFFSDKIFRREARFYQHFMPMLAKFQEEKQLPISYQFRSYPKCYGAIIDDEKQQYIIVLEDLQAIKFKLWDRTKPTTIEIAQITMSELGKFHGLSVAFKDQKPAEFEEFKMITNMILEYMTSKNMQDLFENTFVSTIDSLKNEDHKSIALHIKRNLPRLFSNCLDVEAMGHFAVFCHGDLYNNNLMLRFNEKGHADEIRFLDWQINFFGSPAVDITFNLFTSTDKVLRDKEYDNLIKLYYNSMSNTVRLLGSDPDELFTYEDLLSELKRCGIYALLLVPLVLQVLLANSSEIPNFDEMCDKAVEGNGQIGLVTGLSGEGQSEFVRRINEIFEDVINLGYYEMHLQ